MENPSEHTQARSSDSSRPTLSTAGGGGDAAGTPSDEPGSRRLRLQPDRRFAFFQQFLRRPYQVASVIPSSRFLEQRLVDMADIDRARVVVEFGPGTGGTTRAMLRALPRDSRLLAIEINRRFVSLLGALSDPRLVVHHGSSEDLEGALAAHGLGRPDVVVSGIPFSTMPASIGRRILRAVWTSLAPGGRFVAYQWRQRVAVLGRDILGRPQVGVELLNVPPVRLYCWRKPAETSDAAVSLPGNGG